ncbi:hypothetical protein MTO96_026192 [Rhipicephalus appendiculatus]
MLQQAARSAMGMRRRSLHSLGDGHALCEYGAESDENRTFAVYQKRKPGRSHGSADARALFVPVSSEGHGSR